MRLLERANRMLLNLPWGSSQPVDGYSEVASQTGVAQRLAKGAELLVRRKQRSTTFRRLHSSRSKPWPALRLPRRG